MGVAASGGSVLRGSARYTRHKGASHPILFLQCFAVETRLMDLWLIELS